MTSDLHTTSRKEWTVAAFHALPVNALVLSLFYYWFAIADRYIIFLYDHDMGPTVADTSPFSPVTSSRYWMSGLVASGIVLLLYTGVMGLLVRLWKLYQPPRWWMVWVISWIPLPIGIPLVTMTVNTPTLPLWNAVQCTLVTVIAVGLALLPAQMAKADWRTLLLLALDGFAIAGLLLVLTGVEEANRLWERGIVWPLLLFGAALTGTIVLLLITTGTRLWWRLSMPTARTLFVASLIVAYLLMPLVHYVIGSETGGYHYISNKDNFFASSWGRQLVIWFVVLALAGVMTWLRKILAQRMARE